MKYFFVTSSLISLALIIDGASSSIAAENSPQAVNSNGQIKGEERDRRNIVVGQDNKRSPSQVKIVNGKKLMLIQVCRVSPANHPTTADDNGLEEVWVDFDALDRGLKQLE